MSAPGFITEGEIGNTAAEAQGTDLIPSTGGEVAAATFGRALAMNPTSRLYRLIDRNTVPNPRTMQPDELNEMFGVPGKLSFSEPTTMEVARDLHDYHRAQAIREDTIRRSGGGVGSGMAASFGINVAATLLDPLNVASAFIPFVGEANLAARFGGAAAGALGRLGVRAAEGAGQGFLGAAALEPANYWLSRQDRDDYTMGDAMLNLAFGTVAGSFLHGGLGVLRDARRGLPDWAPESNAAAIRQATAAIAEGRPVMAAEAAEYAGVRQVREGLEDFYGRISQADEQVARIDAEMRAGNTVSAQFEMANTLTMLRNEADQLVRERQAAEIQGQRTDIIDTKLAAVREIEASVARIGADDAAPPVGTPAAVQEVQRVLSDLAEREAKTEQALRDGLRAADDAETIRATRANEAQIAEAPKIETGLLVDDITEAEAAVKRLEDALIAEDRRAAAQARAEGREAPAPDPVLEQANELRKAADSDAKAYEAAAMCAIGRL